MTPRTVLLVVVVVALLAAPMTSIVREPAAMPTRPAIAAVPVAPRRTPARGASRDRSLPGKARRKARQGQRR